MNNGGVFHADMSVVAIGADGAAWTGWAAPADPGPASIGTGR
jgi:hypothetical protein